MQPIEVEYVVSSGAEVIERLKTLKPGEVDMHVILLKADGFVGALESQIPLEVLVTNPTGMVVVDTAFPLLFGVVRKLPLPMNRVAIIKSSWQSSKAYLQHHLFMKDMRLLSKMSDITVDNLISLN